MDATNRLQRSRLALVTLGHFLNDSYGSFFAPLLPVLIEKLSLSLTAASGLAAIPSLTAALFQPLYGMASDRIRGRGFIILGPLVSVVCMGCLGVVPHAVLVGVLLLLAGLGSAAFHPQAVAAAGTVSGARRGLGIAVFTCGGSLGFAVGPLAIIGAVQCFGLDRSYYIILPGLLGVLVLLVALQVPTGTTAHTHMPSLVEAFQGVQGPMAVLFTVAVLREVTRLVLATFLPIVLAMQGRSLVTGGLTLALFSLAGALGGMVGGALSDGWGRTRIIAGSGFLCVPFLYGILHTHGLVALVCLVLGAGMLSGAHSVVIAMAQELVPTRAGTASSLVMGFGWGVAGMVLLGFGSLAEVLGVPRALDLAMAVPLLASGLALWLPHHDRLLSARVTRVGAFARHEE
jgi:FSR family fosmidomycin resistance protein-like MFS transporter